MSIGNGFAALPNVQENDVSILLLGSTDLTAAVLDRLVTLGLRVVGVMSTSETFSISYRPNGIKNARYQDMRSLCSRYDIPFRIYHSARDLAEFSSDVSGRLLLVAGWHHLVPKSLRQRFSFGCIGLHASLLPRYRGGAPLNWALLNGDREAGMSLFALGDGVDDGDLYGQRAFVIEENDTIADLLGRAEAAALDLVSECVPRILEGKLRPFPQRGPVSYGLQRFPEDGLIDWSIDSGRILRLIRAVTRPYPGAFTFLEGRRVMIWRAAPAYDDVEIFGAPGQIASLRNRDYVAVSAGKGHIVVVEATFEDGSDAMAVLARSHNKRLTWQDSQG